jgi:hypothetical protein
MPAKVLGVERRTRVDPTLCFDKALCRNSPWFEFGRVPQSPAPFTGYFAVNIVGAGCKTNNESINICVGVRPKSSQLQNVPHQTLRTPAPLVPFHQRKHTLQKRVYRVATEATLKLVPRMGNDFESFAK